jgi:hypothetical protein
MRLNAALFFVLSCTIILGTAGQRPVTTSASQGSAGAGDDQSQALRDDLNKMRALVQQMEMNLAFVDTSQSPLKHQFQLEIDLWRTMINQMERRIQSRSHENQAK